MADPDPTVAAAGGREAELLPFDAAADALLAAYTAVLTSTDREQVVRRFPVLLERFIGYFDLTGARLTRGPDQVQVGTPAPQPTETIEVDGGIRVPITLELTTRPGQELSTATRALARAVAGAAGVVADRVATDRELEHVATHDDLTGLLNRAAFADRLAAWLADHPGRLVTVLRVDVDRITAVNATYGTEAGDELLRQVARRLVAVLGPDASVGRQSGDEFTALLPDHGPGDALTALADLVQAEIQRPVAVVPGHAVDDVASVEAAEVVRTATLGFASARAHPAAAAELMWCANQAALVGKRRGGAHAVFYDDSMRRADEIRGEVELRIPKALADDELVLYYQPEVDLRSTAVLGAEALVRWNHPTLGLLLPDTFIETVETSPYALSFGRWVLERACEQWARWAERFGWDGADLPRVRVNITPSQLMDTDFVGTVESVLRRTGLPGGGLGLEITERDVVRDQRAAQRTLRGLERLGVTVSIDDFGTGYSSFGQLREFTVSSLKIDRRFVAALASSPGDRSIVEAMLSLARSLHLDVVAEGVQDAASAETLVAMGCRRGQGFFYGRPLPAEDMAEVLVAGRTGTH